MIEQTTAWIDTVNPVVVWVLFLVVAFLHFLPSILAFTNGHSKRGLILLLNFLFGWTVIVWVALLVWATKGAAARSLVA